MPHLIKHGVLLGLLAIAAARPARTQEPEKRISFTGDVGLVNTAGNTRLTTLNVGDKLEVRAGKVLLVQTFALVYGKSEGEQTANSQVARVRADYPLGSRIAVYAFAGYERNRFAGISRRTDLGLGLAVKAWRSERHELDLEAGIGLVQERLFPDRALYATVSDKFASGRAAARYKLLLSQTAFFQQTLEFLPNLEETSDYRINSESALVAPLSTHFALKASYLLKFNNQPPGAELAKTDRMLTTGLQVSW